MVPLFFLTYQTLDNFDENALHGVASHVDVLRASSRVPSFLSWGRGRNELRIPKNVCVVGYAWREVRTNLRRDFTSANSSISCYPYYLLPSASYLQ